MIAILRVPERRVRLEVQAGNLHLSGGVAHERWPPGDDDCSARGRESRRNGNSRALRLGAALLFLAGAFPGCQRAQRPSIETIRVSPDPIPAGSNALVTLEVAYPAARMAFQWTSSLGTFDPTNTLAPSSTYRAPADGAPVRLTVRLMVAGELQSVRETIVQVVDPARSFPPQIDITSAPPLPEGSTAIVVTRVPAYDPRGGSTTQGLIAGGVTGISTTNSTDYKLVIYSKTDDWWIQPTIEVPFTDLADNGGFEQTIHTGSEYAVLLVPASLRPGDLPPRTPILPMKDGVRVLRLVRTKGSIEK